VVEYEAEYASREFGAMEVLQGDASVRVFGASHVHKLRIEILKTNAPTGFVNLQTNIIVHRVL
jgi:hypothetical protein